MACAWLRRNVCQVCDDGPRRRILRFLPKHVRTNRDNMTIKPERATSQAYVLSPLQRNIMVSHGTSICDTTEKEERAASYG